MNLKVLIPSLVILGVTGCAGAPHETRQKITPFDGHLPNLPADATPPAIRHASKPVYPAAALYHGVQGCAWVKFDITASGKPVHMQVLSSIPVTNFGNPAMEALRKWRFVPATEDGKPIMVKGAIQQFFFRLGPTASSYYHVKVRPMPSSCSD